MRNHEAQCRATQVESFAFEGIVPNLGKNDTMIAPTSEGRNREVGDDAVSQEMLGVFEKGFQYYG